MKFIVATLTVAVGYLLYADRSHRECNALIIENLAVNQGDVGLLARQMRQVVDWMQTTNHCLSGLTDVVTGSPESPEATITNLGGWRRDPDA